MNSEKENSEVKISLTKGQAKKIKIGIVVLLFALPLIYLFYVTRNIAPHEQAEVPAETASAPDIAGLEKLVAENPSFDNLVNLSMAYINGGAPARSIDHLTNAIKLNPKSAIAYNNLGVAYTMLQQYQNGMDACRKALDIDPDFQLAKNNLKWATDEKNKVLETIKEQEQVPQNKRDISYYSDHGLNYFKAGDYKKSVEVWNKIFELDGKNTGAMNSIGTAYMMEQRIDDAIALYKKATELEPDNQLAKNNLAWALSEKEKKK